MCDTIVCVDCERLKAIKEHAEEIIRICNQEPPKKRRESRWETL